MKRIQDEWEQFWSTIKPKGAIGMHLHQMRRAFFLGSLLMLRFWESFDSESLQQIREELDEFTQLEATKDA
jgi:hypothetical protein